MRAVDDYFFSPSGTNFMRPTDDPNEHSTMIRERSMDRMGGSLINAILGALILWVGQTTFRHAGFLAGVDERFESVGLQFNAANGRHDALRERLEQAVSVTTDRTRSRFTREDGDKLVGQIKELDNLQAAFERQMLDRLTNIQLKVIAIETHGSNHLEVAALRAEVESLRAHVAGPPGTAYPGFQNQPNNIATGGPVYLPTVHQRR